MIRDSNEVCVWLLNPIGQHINSVNKNNVMMNENKRLTISMSVQAICSAVACIDIAIYAA